MLWSSRCSCISSKLFFEWPTPSSLKQTTELHAHMIVAGSFPAAAAHLIVSIADPQSGSLSYALSFLASVPRPSVFIYNTVIRACCRFGAPKESIRVHRRMHHNGLPHDPFTFQSIFRSCGLSASVAEGMATHALLLRSSPAAESNTSVANSLIHMYLEFGSVEAARSVFERTSVKDIVSWTTMVGGLAKNGSFADARRLFDEMPERNVVSWTAMISGYSRAAGQAIKAIDLFRDMVVSAEVVPDAVTATSVLSACSQLRDLEMGTWVHQIVLANKIGIRGNLAVALIDMYSKCGDLDSASRTFFNEAAVEVISKKKKVQQLPAAAWNALIDGYCKIGDIATASSLFCRMECRDIITFNSMITGYVQSGRTKEALQLLTEIRTSGLQPDKFTMVALLAACASSGSLELGKSLHAMLQVKSCCCIEMDVFIGTALVDMYVKCGEMEQAMEVFKDMEEKDLLAWTCVIVGLAVNGRGEAALEHFELMMEAGVKPSAVAYLGVLSACSHSKLVEEGRRHFREMKVVHGIEPEIDHYGCMIDLLGRSGNLREAMDLVESSVVMASNPIIWASLLSSSRFHKDVEMAEKAAGRLVALEPGDDAGYVGLANVYAASGRWSEASEVRRMMEERGVHKTAAYSAVYVDGKLHMFIAGDMSHPETEEIEAALLLEMTKRHIDDRPSWFNFAADRGN